MNLQQKIIKPKVGLLELGKQLGNVSAACKAMGYSRDSYYRFKNLYEKGGEEALVEMSRKKPILKNRVEESIERAVINIAIEYPAYGQLRASNELKKQGMIISAGGVRSVWLRYYNRERPHSGKYCYGKTPYQTFLDSKHIALEKTNESMYKEAAPDGCDLYDSQIA